MDNIGVTLEFSDEVACQAFRSQIEKCDLGSQPFGVALPERKLNLDNNLLTLLVTFAKDGLPALTAFLILARKILKLLQSDKYVKVKHGKRSVEVKGRMSTEEIKEIAKELLSKE